MAGVLDSAGSAALVALTGICRPDEVRAFALGSHGPEMVIPLSQVDGRRPAAAERCWTRPSCDGIVDRTRDSGAEVVSLLKTGSAYFAPGQSAARMAAAMAATPTSCSPAPSNPPGSTACGTPGSACRSGSARAACARSSSCRWNRPSCRRCARPPTGWASGSGRWPPMRAVVYSAPGEVAVTDVPDPRLLADTDVLVRVEPDRDLRHRPACHLGHLAGRRRRDGAGARVRRHRRSRPAPPSADTPRRRRDELRLHRLRRLLVVHRRRPLALPAAPVLRHRNGFRSRRWPVRQAEYVRVPFADTTLRRLPAGVSPDAALLIGDNLATGWVAMQRAASGRATSSRSSAGDRSVSWPACAPRCTGPRAVVVSDPVAARRQLAATQGAIAVTPGLAARCGRRADRRPRRRRGRRGGRRRRAVWMPRWRAVRPRRRGDQRQRPRRAEWAFPLARSFAAEISRGLRDRRFDPGPRPNSSGWLPPGCSTRPW